MKYVTLKEKIYSKKILKSLKKSVDKFKRIVYHMSCVQENNKNLTKVSNMREWLSWWSAALPRSRPRVRVPSRALSY